MQKQINVNSNAEFPVYLSYHSMYIFLTIILSGTVELENLPLKKTALQGLELPLEVKSGFIGHLKLSIPFRHPKSEPWIIHIDKLYLVAGPLTKHEVHCLVFVLYTIVIV